MLMYDDGKRIDAVHLSALDALEHKADGLLRSILLRSDRVTRIAQRQYRTIRDNRNTCRGNRVLSGREVWQAQTKENGDKANERFDGRLLTEILTVQTL
jgi:hypothetical protein